MRQCIWNLTDEWTKFLLVYTRQTCIKAHLKRYWVANHVITAPSLLSTILDLSVSNPPEVIYTYICIINIIYMHYIYLLHILSNKLCKWITIFAIFHMWEKRYVQSASSITFFTCEKYNQSASKVERLNQSELENSNGFQRVWEKGKFAPDGSLCFENMATRVVPFVP